MKKYSILVEGHNCLVEIDQGICKLGFYTTRYVKASNIPGAKQQALRLVQEELQERKLLLNQPSNSPSIAVDEVYELNFLACLLSMFRGSGGGFTWYPEEKEKGTQLID